MARSIPNPGSHSVCNLLLVSVGIFQVWKKERWSVFIPVLALVGMISAYVIIRASGGRWLQTVDWVSAMFLSIGLVTFSRAAFPMTQGKDDEVLEEQEELVSSNEPRSGKMVWGLAVLLVLVLVGSSPVIAEISLPNQYPASARDERLDELLETNSSPLSADEIELVSEFLDQGGEVLYGRALYPRYFPPDGSLMT